MTHEHPQADGAGRSEALLVGIPDPDRERAKIMERSRRGKKHAAQRGFLNVMSNAPYGYRYITVHDGGGQARFESDALAATT